MAAQQALPRRAQCLLRLPPGQLHQHPDDIFTLRLEHDVNEHLSFRSLTRFANYPRNAVITEPQVCSNGAISATTGKLLAPTSSLNSSLLCPYNQSTDPATILVNRNQIAVKSVENDLWQQDSALIHFKLGHITQSIVVGAEGGREMSNPTRFTFSGVPSATLINPNENLAFTGTRNLNTVTHVAADSGGVYFIDTIKLSRYFDLTGGIRYDYFYTQQRQTPPPAAPTSSCIASIASRPTAAPSSSSPAPTAASTLTTAPASTLPQSRSRFRRRPLFCRLKRMRPMRSAPSGI